MLERFRPRHLATIAAIAIGLLATPAVVNYAQTIAPQSDIAPCTHDAWLDAMYRIDAMKTVPNPDLTALQLAQALGINITQQNLIFGDTTFLVDPSTGQEREYTPGVNVWPVTPIEINWPRYGILYNPDNRFGIQPSPNTRQEQFGAYTYVTNASVVSGPQFDLQFDGNAAGSKGESANPLCDTTQPATPIPTWTPGGYESPTPTPTRVATPVSTPRPTATEIPTLPDAEPIPCAPLALSVILDDSGSMDDADFIKELDANIYLNQLIGNNNHLVALIRFSSESQVEVPLTGDRTAIINKLLEFRKNLQDRMLGTTNMSDGIRDGATQITSVNDKPRFIVITTDGVPDSFSETLAAAEAAKAQGVKIVAIGFGNANKPFLDKIASKGLSVVGDDADTLPSLLGLVGASICNDEQIRDQLRLPIILNQRSTNQPPQPTPTQGSGRITPTTVPCADTPLFGGHKLEQLKPDEKGKDILVGRLCIQVPKDGWYELSPFANAFQAYTADDRLRVSVDGISSVLMDFSPPNCGPLKSVPEGGWANKRFYLSAGTHNVDLHLIDDCGDKIGVGPLFVRRSDDQTPITSSILDANHWNTVVSTSPSVAIPTYALSPTPTPTSTLLAIQP